jgi:hypothetical protein
MTGIGKIQILHKPKAEYLMANTKLQINPNSEYRNPYPSVEGPSANSKSQIPKSEY